MGDELQMSKLQQDFTEGSISRHLIRFSLPFLLANLLQALYSVEMCIRDSATARSAVHF